MSFCSVLWRKITGKYEKLNVTPPATFDAYIDMAGKFAGLVEGYIVALEDALKKGDLHEVALQLPRIIGPLNAIYSLRGDHEGFGDTVCRGKERNQLYEIEDKFEKRIARLVLAVQASNSEMTVYEDAMKRLYFMDRKINEKYAHPSNS